MNFSSISGILLSLAAVIWVALIIPAWFQSSENRSEIRAAKLAAKSQLIALNSTSVGSRSNLQSFSRVNQLRWAGTLGFASAAALLWLSVGNAGLVTAAVLLALGSAVVLRRSLVLKRSLLAQSLRSRKVKVPQQTFKANMAQPQAYSNEANNGWKPNEIPKPMHQLNMNGTLETPVLAEVKALPPKPVEQVANPNLDEILKRRRAI